MSQDELVCPICGEVTSSYMGNYRRDRLCREHAKMLKNGCIEVDEDGLFVEAETGKILNSNYEETTSTDGICIVCGAECRKGYYQCKDCYYETKDYMDGIDGNSSITALRNHYYNLKDYIFRLRDGERILSKCNNLIAIALTNEKINDDFALKNRVYKDVSYIIDKKADCFEDEDDSDIETESLENVIEEKSEIEKEEKKTYYHYSSDGHALDSDMEIRIDDILYSNEIFHCCHKRVNEISERAVVSDWFIPIEGINKGIYIEYWGMDNEKYKQNKEEKIRLYQENDLPLIQIEKDEPKIDIQVFTGHLIAQIRDKAKEYFGAMPKWEKPKRK